jgi:hypothetical protein
MVVLSEYIQIAAAGIYAIAFFYTIVIFRRSKRIDQIGTLNGIMSDLRDLDREVTKISPDSQNDEAKENIQLRRVLLTLNTN